MADDTDFKAPDERHLLIATGAAFLVALLLLMTIILPAEYGIDPTGIGSLLGINDLSGGDTADDTATGGPTRPDLFEITIHAPDGTASQTFLGRNGVGEEGRVVATLAFRPAPRPLTIQATDPASAYFQFLDAVPPDFDGAGDWNVTVRMVEAGDADAGGVPLGSATPDEGNDWTLAFEFEAYELDAGGLAAEAVRDDTVNVTVPAGQGLEYKLFVNEGARITYNWTAAGELFYDFHGERAGDASGDFTSHATGTAAADAGNFTVPFTGTHGWFWQNDSDQDVVVTLRTRGLYAVVGVV